MSELQDYFDYEDADAGAVVSVLEFLADLDDDERLDSPVPGEAVLTESVRHNPAPVMTESWETIATTLVLEVEAWLHQTTGVALVRDDAEMTKPFTMVVPILVELGYSTEVAVEADLRRDRNVADIQLLLTSVDPGRPATAALKVAVEVAGSETRSAWVSTFGVARLMAVPITGDSPRDFRFTWLRRV